MIEATSPFPLENSPGWIGVDLDGTLAYYEGFQGYEHIGEPIPAMIERVLTWLDAGKDVRIFTARADGGPLAIDAINEWCLRYIGRFLPVTNQKDMHMRELWDDRCIQILPNTGQRADGEEDGTVAAIIGRYS